MTKGIHVLTACTRPENLPAIAAALARTMPEAHWHVGFDPLHQHVGGQAVKNRLLEGIPCRDGTADNWILFLDDDTLPHPALYRRLVETLRARPDAAAVVVSQLRRTGEILHAHPDGLHPGGIDAGQALLRRDLIGDARLPEIYDGDGRFLEALLLGRDDVVYLDEVLSEHNALAAAA